MILGLILILASTTPFALAFKPSYAVTHINDRTIEDNPFYDAFGFTVNRNGVLHGVYRRGNDHHTGGHIRHWVSTDSGDTWNSRIIYNMARDDRNVAGGLTREGTLIAFVVEYDGANRFYNQRPLRSIDGETWQVGAVVYSGSYSYFSPYGPLVELPSGKLLQTFYANDDTNYQVYTLESTDDGVTWGNPVTVVDSGSTKPTELALLYLDGATDATSRLLAVTRNNGGRMLQYVSSNGGQNYYTQGELPFSLGAADVSPWLYLRPDGVVILLWADRTNLTVAMALGSADALMASPAGWLSRGPIRTMSGTDMGYLSMFPVSDGGEVGALMYSGDHHDISVNTKSDLMQFTLPTRSLYTSLHYDHR